MEEIHDKNGYQIHPGDVLKVFHFVAAVRREKRYMYKLVVEKNSQLYGVAIHEIAIKGLEKAHCYLLRWNAKECRLTDSEIVEGYGPGDLICYRERPRSRPHEQ